MSGAATLPSSYGFHPEPGTDFSHGQERDIAFRLGVLAQLKKVQIYGISGYRTPGHSVAVGGFANDPHTKGIAADIGVGGATRASAAQLSAADLASVGLYRPFGGAHEINHVQVKPGAGRITFTNLKDFKPPDAGIAVGAGTLKAEGGAVDSTVGAIKDSAQLIGLVNDFISSPGKALLTVLLVVAGGAMLVYGVIRATGGQDTARAAARLIPGVGAIA
jgi:hypothetical protein